MKLKDLAFTEDHEYVPEKYKDFSVITSESYDTPSPYETYLLLKDAYGAFPVQAEDLDNADNAWSYHFRCGDDEIAIHQSDFNDWAITAYSKQEDRHKVTQSIDLPPF